MGDDRAAAPAKDDSSTRLAAMPTMEASATAPISASGGLSAAIRFRRPEQLLALQGSHGNGAVTAIVQRAAIARPPGVQRAPAATAEATQVVNARVDRIESAIKFDLFTRRFQIDREAVASALADMSAEEGHAVRAEYRNRSKFKFSLRDVIAGQAEFDEGTIGNNLSAADRRSLALLLAGTKSEAAPDLMQVHATGEALGSFVGGVASVFGADQEEIASTTAAVAIVSVRESAARREKEVARRRMLLDVNQLKSWLDRGEAEKVLSLLRRTSRSQPEIQALADEYAKQFGESLYNALQSKLKGRDRERAAALWVGATVTADKLAIESDREKLKKAEEDVKKFGPAMAIMGKDKELKEKRRQALAVAEARIEALRAEPAAGAAAAPTEGLEPPAEGAPAEAVAVKSQLEAVLEDDGDAEKARGTLESSLGLGKDALKKGNKPELIGSRLARADKDGSLKAGDIESAIGEVTMAAVDDAQEQMLAAPDLAAQSKAFLQLMIDGYLARFRLRFDTQNFGRPLSKVIASVGSSAERERNAALLAQRGEMPEWQQLYFALKSDKKDMDRVRRILGRKTRQQIDALARQYVVETVRYGAARSLEADLLGTTEERLLLEHSWAMSGEAKEAQREKQILLRGGQFEATATDEIGRLREEAAWLSGRIAELERRVMENRETFAEVRDYLGNLEHKLVKRARDDATTAKGALENALLEHPPNVEAAKDQLAAMRVIYDRLEHNIGVYKHATKEAFDEFVDMAVLVVSTIVTAGQAGPILMAIRATAATVATKFTLKGGYDSVDEFLADIRDGAISAVGGKLADKLVPKLAVAYTKGATKLGTKVGLSQKAAAELTEKVAAKLGPAARWEADYLIGEATTEAITGEGQFGIGAHAMALEQHGATTAIRTRREARKRKTPPPPKGEEGLRKTEAVADAEAAARKAEAEGKPEAAAKPATAEPEAPAPKKPATPMALPIPVAPPPAASPPSRPPTGPVDPVAGGLLPEGSAKSLQDLVDEKDIVIKVRPMNPESLKRLQPRLGAGGEVVEPAAMAKMEIIKSKSITELDEYIGAPPDSRGLVGLFKPHPPPATLAPELHAEATRRYEARLKEWNSRDADYGQLIKEGLIRIEGGEDGGLLMVADPRLAGGPDDKFGRYRKVAGDIDVYDVTHADGTPLTTEQRHEITTLLRSMGIGVEHGAHEWWAQQSPETHKPESDEKIRAEHMSKTPLIAFLPVQSPQSAWADTKVTRPPRESKPGQRITPLRLGPPERVEVTPTAGEEAVPPKLPASAEMAPTAAEEVPTVAPKPAVTKPAGAELARTAAEEVPTAAPRPAEAPMPAGKAPAEGFGPPAARPGLAVGRGVAFEEKPRGQFRAAGKPSEGTTESVIVEDTYDGNKKYIFKPLGGERTVPTAEEAGVVAGHYAERAKAAELASRELGLETPGVQLVVINGRKGSLTEWVAPKNADRPEVMSLADYLRPTEETSDIVATQRLQELHTDPDFQRAWNDIQALDFLINNVDRLQNFGNYLIEFHPNGTFKSLRPIDSELSFTATRGRAVIEKKTTPLEAINLSEPMIDSLLELSRNRNEFIERIRPLVGDKAVDGVLHRLDLLVARALQTRSIRTGGQPI